MAWRLFNNFGKRLSAGKIAARMPLGLGNLFGGSSNGSKDPRVPSGQTWLRDETTERPKFVSWNTHEPSKLLFVDSTPQDLSPDHIKWYESYCRSNLNESTYDQQLRNIMLQLNQDAESTPIIIMSPDAVNLERATSEFDTVQQIFNVYSETLFNLRRNTKRQFDDFTGMNCEEAEIIDNRITNDHAVLRTIRFGEKKTQYLVPQNADGKSQAFPKITPALAETKLSERVLSSNNHEIGHCKKLYSDHPNQLINIIRVESFADAYSILTTAQSTDKIDASEFDAEERARDFLTKYLRISEDIKEIKSEEIHKNKILKRCHKEVFDEDMVHLTQPVADKAVEVTMELLASGKLADMSENEIIDLADELTMEHSFTEKQVLEMQDHWLNDNESKTINNLKQRGEIAKTRLMAAEKDPKSIEPNDGSYTPSEIWKCYILKNLAKIEGQYGKIQFLIDVRDEVRAATDHYPELEGAGHFATPKSPEEFDALVAASEEYVAAASKPRIPSNSPPDKILGYFTADELSNTEGAKRIIERTNGNVYQEQKEKILQNEIASQELAQEIKDNPETWNIVEKVPELARVINAKAEGFSPRWITSLSKTDIPIIEEDKSVILASHGAIRKLLQNKNQVKEQNKGQDNTPESKGLTSFLKSVFQSVR
ncbi:MAG: hypothetical protein GY804_03325 [Alphaproteobacteria bacterium]|nr:hypothetical protein [Alphaproteobacteria bacterium]